MPIDLLDLLFLLLPVAAASGWFLARTTSTRTNTRSLSSVPKDYLVGLNFLLNEQPDQAVDVFIKMLEVDSETVETHLALGNLFRRRGEVDRAIRIHQNLIARPHLDKQYRLLALLSLGQDYFKAGVFDRAERVFLEVIESGEYTLVSLNYLLDIYHQEKNWQSALDLVNKYKNVASPSISKNVAHYYCELAIDARSKNNAELARRHLKSALIADRECVRANLLLAELETSIGQYKAAIRCYKQIKNQDPAYLSEVIPPLIACAEKTASEDELIDYLRQCLTEYPRISVVLALADRLLQTTGYHAAADFVTEQLRLRPSLRGLLRLIELQLENVDEKAKKNLMMLQDLARNLIKMKPIYRCNHCGFNGKVLHWHCPGCKNWGSVKPIHGLEGD